MLAWMRKKIKLFRLRRYTDKVIKEFDDSFHGKYSDLMAEAKEDLSIIILDGFESQTEPKITAMKVYVMLGLISIIRSYVSSEEE